MGFPMRSEAFTAAERLYAPPSAQRPAFTLIEVAFSLVILASAVTFTILILGGALRDQQINRYRILAAAKATTLIERFSQRQEDFQGGKDNAWRVPGAPWNNKYTASANFTNPFWTIPTMIGMMGSRMQGDIPTMGPPGRFDLERVICSSTGGCYPVPSPIARRLDSNNDEIQGIYDRGGRIFYFDPTESSGTNLAATANLGTNRNAATDDLQRLVFSIIGPPQQNILPNHPWMVPVTKLYPYPPSHRESNCNPGSLRIWDKPLGVNYQGGRGSPEGYGMHGSYLAIPPTQMGFLQGGDQFMFQQHNYRSSTMDTKSGTGNHVFGEQTDSSNWEWSAFVDLSSESDVKTRDRILSGSLDDGTPINPNSSPMFLPAIPTTWKKGDKWSPWVAGAPEFRRLLHWHWNRIRAQMDFTSWTVPPPPTTGGQWEPDLKWEFVTPWPTETIRWTDATGHTQTATQQIHPRPGRLVQKGMYWKSNTGSAVTSKIDAGLPTPPNGLGKAVGLRGTDILYEDHEPFPGNRLEQLRLGMPSLERRVMYRTAALALWAKTRRGASIHVAEARLLGTSADTGSVLDHDPNVADDVNLAKTVLPSSSDPQVNQNPLLGFVAPPDDPADIHPAQVLALNYLAHAAMLVTGYRPPFIDNGNAADPAQHVNLHASAANSTISVRNRYYRKFGQETFYLANPMYCLKDQNFDSANPARNGCAANINTNTWVETTNPSVVPAGLPVSTPESYSKARIWSFLTDNFDRNPDPATEGTFVLTPGDIAVAIDPPDANRLCVANSSKGMMKVRRFFEGGSFYRDWRNRGRPNAIYSGGAMAWEPIPNEPTAPAVPSNNGFACAGTPDNGVWRPSKWGPEGYVQDLDPSITATASPDGLNDDAVVNPCPPPFAQEGAFDCWGNKKFSWRVIAPVGSLSKPKSTDFLQIRSFAIRTLEDIAYNDSAHWGGDQGQPGWTNDDVLCGPIEAIYVPNPQLGSLPADCDDLAMANNALRTCMAWVMKYTANNPGDFMVPKPANCMTAWHRPMFYSDLFTPGLLGTAIRPANPVSWKDFNRIGWTGDVRFPALFVRETNLATVDSLYGTYNYFVGKGKCFAASAVRDGGGSRSEPPYAKLSQATAADWIEKNKDSPYKDILRVGPPLLDGVSNLPPGMLEPYQSALILAYLHGDATDLPTAQYGFGVAAPNSDYNASWYPPSFGNTAQIPSSPTMQRKMRTVSNPSVLHYPLGSPATSAPIGVGESHAWQYQPFEVADRCRQLVFWVVDWKSYEDSETTPSDPVDLSLAPMRLVGDNGKMSARPTANPLRGQFNPERNLCWLSQARDRTVARPMADRATQVVTDSNGFWWQFDARQGEGLQCMPVSGFSANTRGSALAGLSPTSNDDSGDCGGAWFYANMGRFGADRDGSGGLTRNTFPASQRMRAREVARFVYYDPVMPLSTRR